MDLSSAFPPPPVFYKQPAPAPPEIPADSYRSYGLVWNTADTLPSLSALGIPELFSNASADEAGADPSYRVSELTQLTRSLLIKYLELVGAMGLAPEQFPERVEEIRILLINMHHLLNEYRPHQARESLIILMEEQLARKRAEIEQAKAACLYAESVLNI